MDQLFEKLYELMAKLLDVRKRRLVATDASQKLFEKLEMEKLPAVPLDGYMNSVQPIITARGFGIKELASEYPVDPEVWLDVAIRSVTRAIEMNEAVASPMEKLCESLKRLQDEM